MTYLFSLGHNPALSEAELRAVFATKQIIPTRITRDDALLEVTLDEPIDAKALMFLLGGTLMIDTEIELAPGARETALAEWLGERVPEGKIHFGISGVKPSVGINIKKLLKQADRSVRYVEIKNSASILHNNLVKKGTHIRQYNDRYFETVALHEFEEIAERDFGRPAFDDKSGMLPPKLARIMLNLAGVTVETPLLDPFCGSGTVLMEAASTGLTALYGTDIAQRAIDDTIKNLDWMKAKQGAEFSAYITLQDVRTLTDTIVPGTVTAIVTEPFMGKPKRGSEKREVLEAEAKELLELYVAALKSFAAVLPVGGVVVFSKPRFRFGRDWITINWNNDVHSNGFDMVPLLEDDTSLLYARENQHVGREIWRLVKHG